MSTRGLIGYYKKGVTKATYNHSDSYPSWLGNKIKDYITNSDVRSMNADFDRIRLVDEDDEVQPEDIIRMFNFWYGDVERIGGEYSEGWYWILRDGQGDLSAYAEQGVMIDGQEFMKDSLFCEWAYIINLDRGVLEIYRGFQQKKPKKNRYALNKEEIAAVKAEKGFWVEGMDGKRKFHKNQYYNSDLIAQIPHELVPDFNMNDFEDVAYPARDGRGILSAADLSPEVARSTTIPMIANLGVSLAEV